MVEENNFNINGKIVGLDIIRVTELEEEEEER